MIHKTLIQNLTDGRKKKGLTQTQLADIMEVKVQTYASWERGLANPGICRIIWLADFFGTQVNEFLGVTNWKEAKKTLPNEPQDNTKLRLWAYMKYEGGHLDSEVEYSNKRFYRANVDVTNDVILWQFIPAKPNK